MINPTTPIYAAHNEAFKYAMQRESQPIYDYWTNAEYKCLFRKNSDTNQIDNGSSTIFYQTTTPIKDGDLLRVKDKIFLVLNQEEIENDVYFKSNLLECSTTIEIFSSGKELKIPCYAYDLLSTNPSSGEIISVVNGSIELLTQKNSYSDNLEIGSSFVGLGGSYKVVNLYYKSNILHIFVQRQLDAPAITYALKVDAKSQYAIGSTHKLTATATRAEYAKTEVVTNADIKWSSSNPAICSVSSNGTIMCLQAGTVSIAALWVDKEITSTISFDIVESAPKICTIDGASELAHGIEEVYTATFNNDNGKSDPTITPIWSLELPQALKGFVTLQNQKGNTIEVFVADKSSLVKQTFMLNLTDNTGQYAASKSLKVIGWF